MFPTAEYFFPIRPIGADAVELGVQDTEVLNSSSPLVTRVRFVYQVKTQSDSMPKLK